MRSIGWLMVLCACPDGGDDPMPDAAMPDAPAVTCTPPAGAGTTQGSGAVNAPTTWTAAASPHVVTADLSVNAALTIEPCAVVRIADDRSITVRAGASLTAIGTAEQPIVFERADPNASWARIYATGGGTIALAYTTLRGGGDPQNTIGTLAGALDIAGTAPATQPILTVDHVTVEGSESNGVNLHDGGGFTPASRDLTVTGSAIAPIVTFARHVGTIPTGTYTGNTLDAIVMRGTGGPEVIAESTTIRDRGVKYRVGVQNNAVLDVVNLAAAPTLTIEPGVKIEFLPGSAMRIDPASATTPSNGALVAVGTAAKPITFTSAAASPAAGDWLGMRFGGAPLAATRLDHVRVEHAGQLGSSGSDSCIPDGQTGANDAAIRILGGIPATVFITNTTIVSSARHGIDLGFRSDVKPDFKTSNTFIDVPRCQTTRPRDANGACPAPSTCL